jgi:hypothetical protein
LFGRQLILDQASREREELQQVIFQIERDFAMEEGKSQVPRDEFKGTRSGVAFVSGAQILLCG